MSLITIVAVQLVYPRRIACSQKITLNQSLTFGRSPTGNISFCLALSSVVPLACGELLFAVLT